MIDVLNRYGDPNNIEHTIHVMKYIFPKQFGLHNAFSSAVDPRETVQPFKDYTLREREIAIAHHHDRTRKGIIIIVKNNSNHHNHHHHHHNSNHNHNHHNHHHNNNIITGIGGISSKKSSAKEHLPRRIHAGVVDLVKKFQKFHARCSYTEK